MARSYKRDARGRFAGAGYSGQTGGRGARLMAKGQRKGGGAKMTAGRAGGTIGKPRGLKPQQGVSVKPKTAGTVAPKDVRRYRMLQASRHDLQKKIDADFSRLHGSLNRTSAGTNAIGARYDLNRRKRARTDALLNKLSNTKPGDKLPNPPSARYVSPRVRGKSMGKGPYSAGNKAGGVKLTQSMPFYSGGNKYSIRPQGQVNKVKGPKVAGVARAPRRNSGSAPSPAASSAIKPRGVAAASRAYGQKVRNVLGMRMLGAQRGGIRSSAVGKQGNLFGGSDSVKGYKATRSQVRPGRYKSGRIRSGSYSGRS